MDKYEFNIKVEQIKKMAAKGDYETAMKIADTIDWRRVRNVNILSMAASVYEKNEEYQEAKDILLLAFERAPIGKRLLYKLAELAIKEGNTAEAEDYYREFCDLAPDDPRQYILRYLILGAKGAPVEQLIHTLEQYCNVELDEKWLYELAELYNEAGMGDLCVMTCDKIMLMFGLGKYVDKAMELKLQYAPLTSYQMDLVENRDKYEAKLKAVEREYRERVPSYTPASDQEAAYTREPADESGNYDANGRNYEPFVQEPVQEPDYGETAEMPESDADAYASESESAEAPVSDTYAEAETEESEESPITFEPEYEPEQEPADEPEAQWTSPAGGSASLTGDELKARLHEAEAQAHLAREMSKISDEAHESKEPEEAQTRILSDIRSLNREMSHGGASHLMIETDVPEDGLNLAIQALKKIHQETGAKNQAAKITGEKLNRRGIFTLSDKLTGKDLIIEQAGDMNEAILQELNQLMARDETGMNIVLIDTPERLKELYRIYPGLAKRFECIRTSAAGQPETPSASADSRPARPVSGAADARPASGGVRPVSGSGTARPVSSGVRPSAGPAGRPAAAASSRVQPPSGGGRVPAPAEARPAAAPARPTVVRPSSVPHTAEPVPHAEESSAEDTRPVRRVQPKRDIPPMSIPVQKKRVPKEEAPAPQEEPAEQEMDIDEFAQYACQYAGDIDCSISGKSMLALYERIEIMEEEGIPLTKANAEDLIEEAADKAENPALVKKLTGIFSSKYDKDGLLILKEEHFL